MTIPSNLSSTRLSSLASTPAAEKPATANNPGATRQPQESAAKAHASLPAGLVGHNVNTTA
ncbi:hypothetical protein LMG28614_03988 [Paraburkholderia ultramafica]|uniref:Uncharacterized protein n=1 Tax=Paraburkholderia ultramafica TaxID=1544867 RepID=A0A6S7BDE5_9BURK|nr:hypothetical protein [Paraburkholderia ultramafica]CAB3794665.1 hypothetical protein LMG28614_03988 [Paraburkholderia ultramafica]